MIAIWVIVIVLLLIILDEQLGRKRKRASPKKEYPMRQSDMTLFTNGKHLFADYFQSIEQATHHIHILFYIVKTDEISQQFFSLLQQKAKEGIEVRLLVDWVGSFGLPRKTIRSLKKSGVRFAYSQKPTFPYFFYQLNRRNHRKITVIDGTIGYIGGFNIGKEYIGQDADFGDWRDYHLKVSGEGVADLQAQFLDDWKATTRETVQNEERYFPPLPNGAIAHRFIATNGDGLEEDFSRLIRQAQREIMIGSPYFIPGKNVMDALLDALKRQVAVTILVPLKADHLFVKEAAFPYFYRLLKAGAHIHRFYQGFYHAKTIIVDDNICNIGTANFDKRSFFLNGEMNCFIYDRAFTQQMKHVIRYELSRSERLTLDWWKKRSVWERGKESLSTLLSQWL
ncbi:cardiolipin synthase [Anoxybacillus tepidamans]|uniref:Cardiolipin synthase n=1 Tax=Anoxybacteroides tepidamans TaxID=265948 RepID=A0A7W8INX0_9BACL|nr:cardiolipin synthase [Anoxybacillus tepidamans]MBB5324035.1 cardiolipin synthase [Anoxybacillus tepidamans]